MTDQDQKKRIQKVLAALKKIGELDFSVGMDVSPQNDDLSVIEKAVNQTLNQLQKYSTECNKKENVFRESQEQLQFQSHQTFQELIDRAPLAIIMFDPESRVLLWNAASEKLYGWKSDEVIGQFPPTIPENQYGSHQAICEQVLNGESITDLEMTRLRKDGVIIYIALSLAPLRDVNGDIYAMMSIGMDISERRKTEEALRQSEERLRSLYENTTIGFYRTTPNGRILMANPVAVKMLGYSSFEELAKLNLEHAGYAPSYSRDDFKNRLEKNGMVLGIESAWITKNGATIFVRESTKAIRDEKGNVLYYDGTFEDITDRKMAEIQIQKDLKEKELLLKEIHHRVKNNLQIICSLLNLQSQKITDKKALAAFKQSCNRVFSMALVHERLYQSKDFSNINFKQYILNLIAELKIAYHISSKINLNTSIEDIYLGIDIAIPCGLILNELITNAFQHAFPDNRNGRVRITMKTAKNDICIIKIKDNGIGFSDHVDIQESKTLGLKMVHMLVDQVSGKLQVTNNQGLCFLIKFPLQMSV